VESQAQLQNIHDEKIQVHQMKN